VKNYILSRLIQFPLILATIYLLTFACVWFAPGDPFSGTDRAMDPSALLRRKQEFNATSAWDFLSHYPLAALKGDFGRSLVNDAFTVNELIGGRLAISLILGFMALGIAVVVGMFIGTISAVKRDGILDWAGMTLTLVGISLPSFVVASVLMIVFVAWLDWFNIAQARTPWDFVLPSIALSLGPMAYIVRLQRVSMLDVLGSDHVRTARAKGLSKPRVVVKHCLRNAFLPVFTYLGPAAALTLTGSFVVEQIFVMPGLGQQFVNSITSRDATMILAQTMIYSALLLALNLFVDICYVFIDPRIDIAAKKAA
jgi:oligopeptide transport system permease protein